jgi:hypothetical protein
MEAVTIRRKYRQIRGGLLDDSVRFEAALRQVEADIRKQDNEINRLQVCSNKYVWITCRITCYSLYRLYFFFFLTNWNYFNLFLISF